MLAGSDTTSTSMTYASWELGRRPELQEKIREELKRVMPNLEYHPTNRELENLPLFNAFMKVQGVSVYYKCQSCLKISTGNTATVAYPTWPLGACRTRRRRQPWRTLFATRSAFRFFSFLSSSF
jgi:hypothetical protein